jgi:hypothetical protein
VAPDRPICLPLQSIALRTGTASFLTVRSGLAGVGLIGDRWRAAGAEASAFRHQLIVLKVVWLFLQAPPGNLRLSDGFRAAGWSGRPRVDLVTEPLLDKTRAGSCGPFRARATRRSLWVGRDSSHGVQRSPLRRYKCCASTPRWENHLSARRRQPLCLFRPCRSTRLRRFTPLNTLQVYCTLQPAMGFAMFLALLPPLDPKAVRWRWLHPRWRIPFEAFPSLVAVPCHHGLGPLAVGHRFGECSARVAARFPDASAGSSTSGL